MNKIMLKKQYMMYSPKKKGRLPSEFQEVEYIQGTGTQYLNTLVIPTSKTGWEIEFEQEKKDIWYFGVDTDWLTNGFGFNVHKKQNTNDIYPLLYINSSASIEGFETLEANKRYVVKYGNGFLRVNNKEYSVPSFTGTLNIPIYTHCINRNNVAGSTKQGTGKIYSLKFYEDNTIIRDYIPCYRKSDNEIGLYDIVNNQFYTNQGSGSFIAGNEIFNIDGYKQLEYISNSGTQWIDTGLILSNSTALNINIDAKFLSYGKKVYNTLFGTQTENDIEGYRGIFIRYMNTQQLDVYGLSIKEGYYIDIKYNFDYTLTKSLARLYIDNTLYGEDTTSTREFPSIPLYIMGMNGGGGSTHYSEVALYGCKITLDNVLVRNFIPMRRLSDNELGLYDLVNGVFYTNQGSGSFIAGEVLKS